MQRRRGVRRPRGHRKAHLASAYIQWIEKTASGTPLFLLCRVSSDSQNANGNNADQEAGLRTAAEKHGLIVLGVEAYSGRAADAEAWLYGVANKAARAGAALLAESTSRFTRPHRYHPKHRPHLVAGANELRNLPWICGAVPLVTVLPPDASWKEERAYQSKRGQRQKNMKGGRPAKHKPGYKKQRREQLLPQVRRLWEDGNSFRAIAQRCRTSDRNVRRWLRRFL